MNDSFDFVIQGSRLLQQKPIASKVIQYKEGSFNSNTTLTELLPAPPDRRQSILTVEGGARSTHRHQRHPKASGNHLLIN